MCCCPHKFHHPILVDTGHWDGQNSTAAPPELLLIQKQEQKRESVWVNNKPRWWWVRWTNIPMSNDKQQSTTKGKNNKKTTTPWKTTRRMTTTKMLMGSTYNGTTHLCCHDNAWSTTINCRRPIYRTHLTVAAAGTPQVNITYPACCIFRIHLIVPLSHGALTTFVHGQPVHLWKTKPPEQVDFYMRLLTGSGGRHPL